MTKENFYLAFLFIYISTRRKKERPDQFQSDYGLDQKKKNVDQTKGLVFIRSENNVGKKEKMLVTSIFSFYSHCFQTLQENLELYDKRLNSKQDNSAPTGDFEKDEGFVT